MLLLLDVTVMVISQGIPLNTCFSTRNLSCPALYAWLAALKLILSVK